MVQAPPQAPTPPAAGRPPRPPRGVVRRAPVGVPSPGLRPVADVDSTALEHGAETGLPLWLALLTAVAAGPMLDTGFPDGNIWPLTFVGIAMMLLALRGRSFGGGVLVGLVGGLSFYLVHIEWATVYLGPLPWIALSTLEALFFALGSGCIAVAYRRLPAVWRGPWSRIGMLSVVVAGLWTAREAWASVWPYGGFAWGRMGLSQTESPFGPLLAWVGVSGLTFLMVFVVAVIIQCVVQPGFTARLKAAVAVFAVALVLAVPAWPALTHGSTRIAAVQGNAKAGYFDARKQGDILNAHVSATLPLIGDRVDMVVWPEDGSDVDPMTSPQAARVLDYITENMGAPLVAGTITHRDGKYYNTSFVWDDGQPVTQLYDKKHPVPFGEYVPDRAFWRPFAPELIDLIGREYTPGTRPNVFTVNGVKAGVAICFDIADDQLIKDMMTGGAQVILAQTNNADFGRTDESVQQLAIARARAIETGRSVVNISTVGTSAIIGPDGRTLDQLPWYTAGAMVQDVPIGVTTTPATLLGRGIEWLVSGLGLAGLALALVTRRTEQGGRRR